MPKDGSMTLGVYLRSDTLRVSLQRQGQGQQGR